jgi:putative ABC transport system ATP-binding protein
MNKHNSILQVENLTKTYRNGEKSLTVLDNINFTVEPGISCAIVGPSGSGKTTLLGLCAGLDQPSSGRIILKGHQLDELNEDELAAVRNRHIGFVFQTFQLVPTLTAIENVMVPLELRGERYQDVYQRAHQLLETVGLSDRIGHYPTQ